MIGIVNYGTGNIRAIINQLDELKLKYVIINSHKDFNLANQLVLPGVGAFDYCKKRLLDSLLIDGLNEHVLVKKKPILGICVGMQLMATKSEEGQENGLNWIEGEVKKFRPQESLKKIVVPHMGWNSIRIKNNSDSILYKGVDLDHGFYFVHSFYYQTDHKENILTETNYGSNFCSSIFKENIFGVQFHPEKSHTNGTQLIKNFSKL